MQITIKMLEHLRNILLPSLFDAATPNIDLDIEIDKKKRALIIVGTNKKTKNELAFALTKHAIASNRWKKSFRPALVNLVEMLERQVDH